MNLLGDLDTGSCGGYDRRAQHDAAGSEDTPPEGSHRGLLQRHGGESSAAGGSGEDVIVSFPCSRNGRHLLTTRPSGWSIINVHAESGGRPDERDYREKQLQYMSRLHESEEGLACVLAGDFNMRVGEEQWLVREGWRDVLPANGDEWTWQRGPMWKRKLQKTSSYNGWN